MFFFCFFSLSYSRFLFLLILCLIWPLLFFRKLLFPYFFFIYQQERGACLIRLLDNLLVLQIIFLPFMGEKINKETNW